TNGVFTDFASSDANAWANPRFLYTPLAEYQRPRFDVGGAVFDYVTGEFLDLRRLIPLEQWTPVIGIDAHSLPDLLNGIDPILKEVNVILTDVGGDPLGPPGNGGFNPMTGLETFTNTFRFPIDFANAVNRDFAFNGCWVWHDTENNFVFDQ